MIAICVVLLLIFFGIAFLMQPKFGKQPSGKSLESLRKSPNFDTKMGSFQNLSHTPALAEGMSYGSVMKDFLLNRNPQIKPKNDLPNVKTDLFNLKSDEDVVVWFGHSSYFLRIDGKNFLVDPVFGGSASPLSMNIKAFPGSNTYQEEDMPEIDFLFLTHDHWDHLDYTTLTALRPKIKQVICGLGVRSHLDYWGFNEESITELDWDRSFRLSENMLIHTVPARHFSGRRFKRNGTLWTSFVLKTTNFSIFIGGDSGYDNHFKKAGEEFGPFDLAILENGQYDEKWKYIHMLPHETLEAAQDLKTRTLLPVHHSKFALANHAWNKPLESLTELYNGKDYNFNLITPKIGEKVNLKSTDQQFEKWWVEIDN